jgi:hypothetical protein
MVRPGQKCPKFFCDPYWSNEEINRPLEKRRMIAFDSMPQEQQSPAADKEGHAPNPFHKDQEYDPSKNHGDADAM